MGKESLAANVIWVGKEADWLFDGGEGRVRMGDE